MKSEIRKLEAENKKLKERIAELEKKQSPEPQDDIPSRSTHPRKC
jgi:cell division protein FtsB